MKYKRKLEQVIINFRVQLEHLRDREEIRELAELYPSESLIQHPDWKEQRLLTKFY